MPASHPLKNAFRTYASGILPIRKFQKLRRDPERFLLDSRYAPFRTLGRLYSASLREAAPPLANASSPVQELDALALRYGTDKSSVHHNYVRYYAPYFAKYKGRRSAFLEIGVKDGASLKMWKTFLPGITVHGIDNRNAALQYAQDGIAIHVGLQQDHAFLNRVVEKIGRPIDIIVDDGSHHNPYTIASFEGLFPHLAPGGVYAIEDLHCSYEEHRLFNNERSQIIRLFVDLINAVDLNGRRDVLKGVGSAQDFAKLDESTRSKLSYYERWIESVHFYQGLVFVLKRAADA